MKIWLTKAIRDSSEVVIADSSLAKRDSVWHQYSAAVPEWPFVVMNFGVLANGQVWFDFMRSALQTQPISVYNCFVTAVAQRSDSLALDQNRRRFHFLMRPQAPSAHP
jgi:hypothetical protein